MSYQEESDAEIMAKNAFLSYRRGWVDAAQRKSMSHDDTTAAYVEGYGDGYNARADALTKATAKFGYKQRIILDSTLDSLSELPCPHPPANVTADIMEGDYGSGVRWCRLCGAYQRYFYLEEGMQENSGTWVEPAIETLKH